MRVLPFACSLSFVVLTGATFAQPDAQLKDAAAPLAHAPDKHQPRHCKQGEPRQGLRGGKGTRDRVV